MKRVLSLALALVMAFSCLPAAAFAAEYSVGSDDDLASSWNDANSNSDSTNSFNMTADIDMSGHTLQSNSGKTYNVNGNGNTISNVDISGDNLFSGTVNINADVVGTTDSALAVTGDVSVKVTGNVIGTDVPNSFPKAVISANDSANVTVQGDVYAEDNGVAANSNSVILVKGDITLEDRGPNNQAIVANDSTVMVNGDVNSGELGIMANNGNVYILGDVTDMGGSGIVSGSNVSINGSYTSNMDTPIYQDSYSGTGIDSDSSLKVGGDLQVHDLTVFQNSSLQVDGTVTAEKVEVAAIEGYTQDASQLNAGNLNSDLTAGSKASVEIGQNHQGDLNVSDSAKVTIGGDSTGENTNVHGTKASVTVKGDLTNSGSTTVMGGGKLHVDGDLTNTSTDHQEGIVIINNSDLYVGGNTDAINMSVVLDSTADLGMMDVSNLQVGASGERDDNSRLTASTTSTNKGNLSAYGSSETVIRGSILGKVTARDNARVEIWGTANSIDVQSPAIVVYNIADLYGPTKVVTDPDEDPLLTLCRSYTQGSQLQKQTSDLFSIMSQASNELTERMNLSTAFVASLFHHEDINSSGLKFPQLEADQTYSCVNQASLDRMQQATVVSNFHVNLYKENLHKAFLSLDNKNIAPDAFDQGEVKTIMKICKGYFSNAKDATDIFPKEQYDHLATIVKNGAVSFSEAKEFLFEHGYYTKDSKLVDAAAQRLCDMFAFFSDLDSEDLKDAGNFVDGLNQGLEVAGKTMTAIDLMLTSAEFVDFWIRDYEGQISVLDRMIKEQEMSPEMLLAAVSLRNEYNQKFREGIMNRVAELGLEHCINLFKNKYPLYSIVEGSVNLLGLVTGGTAYSQDVMNGAALCSIVPELMENYESSILAVRNGDTSEDALRAVQANYTLLTSALKTMCELAGDVTKDKSHEQIFEDYVDQLNNLTIGTDIAVKKMYFN